MIQSITVKRNVTALTLHSNRMLGSVGFLKTLFGAFSDHAQSVDLISTSEVSVSLTLESTPSSSSLEALITDLRRIAEVQVHSGRAVVSCVGEALRTTPGVAARLFSALSGINIHMISQGASELNLGLVLDDDAAPEAVRRLHDTFFASHP